MKKVWLITLTLVVAALLCIGFTACGTVEQLVGESGILLEGGGFPKGSVLNFNEVEITEEKAAEILDKLAESGVAINDESKAYIYDIFVTNKDAEVQPDGTVKITIPAPEDEKAEGYNVYHIKDSGAIENIPATLTDGKISFETDGFSYYVMVPQYNVMTFYWNTQLTVSVPEGLGGKVFVNGTEYAATETIPIQPDAETSLKAEVSEGYVFGGWTVSYGEVSTSIAEAEGSFKMPYDNATLTATFLPKVTGLDIERFGDTFVYDPNLVSDAKALAIRDFEGAEEGKEYLVTGILVSVQRGRMNIRDESGARLTVVVADSLNKDEIYECYKNRVGEYVAVCGVKGSDYFQPALENATFPSFKANFENAYVRGEIPDGMRGLKLGVDYEVVSNVDWTKVGEYTVVYQLIDDPAVSYTINVYVVGDRVDFNAYAKNGTLLLDGADIGPDYYEEYKNGFGKVTLTAKGDEGTVFKGWYTNEATPKLISTEATYTFEFSADTDVFAEFEYVATEIYLDFSDPENPFYNEFGVTEIYLPLNGQKYDLNTIPVYAFINHEGELLSAGEYTIDAGGFNGTAPAQGNYTVTFTYKADPSLKVTHVIRVFDEETMVSLGVSAEAGGRVTMDPPYNYYNKGDKVTLTVELRSEKDYEFLGWYSVIYGTTEANSSETLLSKDKTYTVTLNESMDIVAKIEPKVTYLDVVVSGYPTNPAKIPLAKFSFDVSVYACGALGLRNELTANDYTVDMGGLNVNSPAVGKYTVTYTYKADTSIKYELVVWVWNKDHSFRAYTNSPDCGLILFDGEITHEAGGQYIDGEEITVTALEKEGFTFLGWYKIINKATHEEFELITTEQAYTFTITADTSIMAKFDSVVTEIWLDGNVSSNQSGQNVINVYRGEKIDIGGITVYGTTFMGYDALRADEYTVDLGGLDPNNPVAGNYVITYTYKENTELTACIYVTVLAPTYSVKVEQYHEPGYVSGEVEYEGNTYLHLYLDVEEGKTVILKAIERTNFIFAGWYVTGYDNYGEWELYSTNAAISVTVTDNMILAPVYMPPIVGLHMHQKADIYDAGVMDYEFSGAQLGCWDEELGCYVAYGHVDLYADSKYATDITTLFEDFHLVAVDGNGHHKQISHEDLTFDLGDYKAEEGWYEIKVSYGSFTMTVNVMVMPA